MGINFRLGDIIKKIICISAFRKYYWNNKVIIPSIMENIIKTKRYETKFRITRLNYYEIENLVKTHPAIFHEIYNKRNINNIYFDTHDLSNYLDNVEGETVRQKV